MSSSPPPGPWGGQPGAPGFGQPHPGLPPPGYQQPWYPPPGPPNKGNGTRWLIAGALVAVIAVAAAVIVVVLHSNSGDSAKGSTSSASAAGIASADDKGPVTVITADPSCASWTPIINTATDRTNQTGWNKRDPSIPASAWTPEQRTQYQEATKAMLAAADQTVTLARLTPHRVMRELYEQLIAYSHAYAESIVNYTPIDDKLARVTTAAAATVSAICDAITHGSAAARAPLVTSAQSPTGASPPSDPAKPARFLTSANPVCRDWDAQGDAFNAATAEWQKTDGNIPVSQWSTRDKALNDAFVPVMNAFDEKTEELGRRSGNPTLEDLAVLTAQYGSAFVKSFPTYAASDQYLYAVTGHSTGVVSAACEAVGA